MISPNRRIMLKTLHSDLPFFYNFEGFSNKCLSFYHKIETMNTALLTTAPVLFLVVKEHLLAKHQEINSNYHQLASC